VTTPGFTAEASLPSVIRRYGRALSSSLRAGQLLASAQLESSASRYPEQSGLPMSAIKLDLYGCWCGPGQSGPGPPVDPIDQACCRHDMCFSARGYDRCSCNRELIEDLSEAIFDSRSSAEGRAWAVGIISGLLEAPCWCECCVDIDLGITSFELCQTFPGLGGLCLVPFCG
jgi:hypothetical protein